MIEHILSVESALRAGLIGVEHGDSDAYFRRRDVNRRGNGCHVGGPGAEDGCLHAAELRALPHLGLIEPEMRIASFEGKLCRPVHGDRAGLIGEELARRSRVEPDNVGRQRHFLGADAPGYGERDGAREQKLHTPPIPACPPVSVFAIVSIIRCASGLAALNRVQGV
jgi:hypothetical protein